MGCTGPAKAPTASSATMTSPCGICPPKPNNNTPASVAARQASVTFLYSLFLSTIPPRMMPPTTMASSKPAPERSTVPWSKMPARPSFCSMKAPTTFVTEMETTNAASGGTKPGVRKSCTACSGKEISSSELPSAASAFSSAEKEGGEGGRSWKKMREATATRTEAMVMNPKYSFSPPSEPPIAPPTRKAAAIPTWLKLMATAVARERSSFANHVAESRGGVHWKKGWATATIIVPATTTAYVGSCSPTKGTPDRNMQPTAISAAAPTIGMRRPKRRTRYGSKKQAKTLVNRNMSMRVAGS
mmetsp:Transcript_27138/g.73648  ORF Transcript_27138/g.73648 Transcript_27138/m.73648 type:complete len:301 (-) Transcript_27138:272-1174(-)